LIRTFEVGAKMSEGRVERRLAAILAADVVGYSRLMGYDEAGTLARLKTLRRELIDPKIAEHKGRIVKTTGDGILIEFSSVVEAVACAVAVQKAMPARNEGTVADRRIEFRVGIHQGDIIVEDGDIFGDGVNLAARLEGLAEPGGICISRVVRDEIRDKLDFAFDDMGEQSLKNIARPMRVFAVNIGARASHPPAAGTEAIRPMAEPAPLALPDKPSLVVLPFQNMSGDPEQEYFADGMVEEITTAISRLPWLFVIARNSSFTYKGKAVDIKQVGHELGVRYVLEGSVRKAGNRVRITGQLIDTATGAHIWADRIDGGLDDIFDLQDQVASSVAGAIEPRLRQSEIERASRKPTASLDAYDLYLRGLAQFHDLRLREAVRLAERALAIDPTYGPAAALAAWSWHLQIAQGWERKTPELAATVLRLAKQAIDNGRDDPDALWMAGGTIGYISGDQAAAAAASERAIVLNPNAAQGWSARGWIHNYLDEPDPAVAAFERAMRLSPLDPLGFSPKSGLARAHLTAGRYDEAIRWVDQAIATQPRWATSLWIKVVLCELTGRHDEAAAGLVSLLEASPDFTIDLFLAYSSHNYTDRLRAVYVDAFRKAGVPEG
jgi:TolB-like protein/class 3 adenylate cyclase/tetratricopeptide (TPR) repeat protein